MDIIGGYSIYVLEERLKIINQDCLPTSAEFAPCTQGFQDEKYVCLLLQLESHAV